MEDQELEQEELETGAEAEQEQAEAQVETKAEEPAEPTPDQVDAFLRKHGLQAVRPGQREEEEEDPYDLVTDPQALLKRLEKVEQNAYQKFQAAQALNDEINDRLSEYDIPAAKKSELRAIFRNSDPTVARAMIAQGVLDKFAKAELYDMGKAQTRRSAPVSEGYRADADEQDEDIDAMWRRTRDNLPPGTTKKEFAEMMKGRSR